MIRIYVRKQNEESGHVFKSRFSVLNDRLSLFPFSFVLRGLISEDEYLDNNTTIANRFGLYITENQNRWQKQTRKISQILYLG